MNNYEYYKYKCSTYINMHMHRYLFFKLHLITEMVSEVHCNNMILEVPLEHKNHMQEVVHFNTHLSNEK